MTKWEYRVEQTDVGGTMHRNLDKMTNSWLNAIGQEGWELVSITTLNVGSGLTSDKAHLTFKRPIDF